MSKRNYVCFACRTGVRRKPYQDKPVLCSNCGKACLCIGYKIPVPRKTKSRHWRALEDLLTNAWSDFERSQTRRNTRRKHELERRIATLQRRAENASPSAVVASLQRELSEMNSRTRTLFRPVGPNELTLIRDSGMRRFPPRLPDQPIFYPVLNQEYARQIARDWNVKASGSGYVTRFEVDKQYLEQFPRKVVGGSVHEELWVPAEELDEFNAHIVGLIEVVESFGDSADSDPAARSGD